MNQILPPEWGAFLKKQAKVIAIGMAIITMCLFGLSLYWFITIDYTLEITPVLAKQPPTKKPANSQDKLENMALFGNFIPKHDNIPSSLLNLKVVGILKGNARKNSEAIIQLSNGKEKIYAINDILPGDAKIIRIHSNYLLIERLGKVERLSMKEDTLKFDNPPEPLEFNHD